MEYINVVTLVDYDSQEILGVFNDNDISMDKILEQVKVFDLSYILIKRFKVGTIENELIDEYFMVYYQHSVKFTREDDCPEHWVKGATGKIKLGKWPTYMSKVSAEHAKQLQLRYPNVHNDRLLITEYVYD